ncbi:ketopantoate reductase family protein [Lentzea flaviverrucosa]|uniref:2-dehydropantoate 2-reductase n=1 Tax=Lentzea flaviverrucosa TaxID=200379 RepID=A0A1H9JR28_9PSEU|nr:2-dehydropantoate 2-reductase N-terminal domain-containing protein [Lentzea flaviverrucosa]RDI26602.1 ketopantoate reductase [Lentzea flaviverrucosa]SEQ89287.1 2-dehydropantoate 2-reductase [Lentzea flaviverrucosa]
MKILMFGRGVIATVYGWALEQAGHDVEFYVRPGRAAEYGDTTSLDLLDMRRSLRGQRVVREWPVRLREELGPDHDFDLIVLSVGHHRLTEAADFLAPRVGRATVLVFGNIWAEPLDAIGALPAEQVAWGFPLAGGGFGENGVLRGAILPSVLFGTVGPQAERGRVVRRVFREAGFRIREEPDFRGWLLIHFVSDAGLFSQGLRLGALADLAGRRRDLREALLAGRELLPLVEARGVVVGRRALLFRAPTWLAAPLFAWLTAHFGPVRDNFATHSDPTAEEPRAICRDVLAEARRLGVAAPRLAAAEPSFAAPVQ